jgi:hypothetical protein
MTLSEFRKRSNAFVANLPATIEKIVNFNEDLEKLNKDRLRRSELTDGKPITNLFTNQSALSPGYAAWKSQFYPSSFGSGKINLLLTGDLDNNTDLIVRGKEYFIESTVPYMFKLNRKYGPKLMGIGINDRPKAYAITTPLLAKEYKSQVL